MMTMMMMNDDDNGDDVPIRHRVVTSEALVTQAN